ncbi:MAG TPA: thiamine phosphate synthase [Thermoanaerobaculia bacterium]|nr:thiamine phosphate synthase [Thermoanaerobaculia bacterium]
MTPGPGPVYGIADAAALGGTSPAAAAAAMARGGIAWVQLRAKEASDAELHEMARACARALEGTGAHLWIDDRPDVAALVGAAGVHLGQEDLPPAAARRVVGGGVWIGRSTHDRDQVAEADRDPDVDVIAVGPVFATATKERPDPVVGLDLVAWARRATKKPLVAIGGIDASNLASVLAAGADAAAVISAVCSLEGGGDVEANARRLCDAAEEGGA